jgi:Tfp pilus assembly protein PilF
MTDIFQNEVEGEKLDGRVGRPEAMADAGGANGPDARVVAAMERAGRGDRVGAIADLTRALESEGGDDVPMLCARASLYMLVHRLDQADADIRRALKSNDGSAEAQLQYGTLLCRRARWREAIEPLQRAVALDPSHGLAHYQLGEAYNQTDHLLPALASYETAAKLQPDNRRALKWIGVVLDRLGRPAEATAAYQRAREAPGRKG